MPHRGSDHRRPGSSPRVRGTQMGRRTRRPAARFIPACAGNSTVAHATPTIVAVHPRVCGELTSEFWRQRNRHGSSPRVRGTRRRSAPLWRRPAVHPRVCGELRVSRVPFRTFSGSSPRVRGTRHSPPRMCWLSPVHPRVCGELRRRAFAQARGGRFIPACAGNSPQSVVEAVATAGSSPRVRGTRLRSRPLLPLPPVHPRVCGELYMRSVLRVADVGSSPRVRELLQGRRLHHRVVRFIPACAGNSLSSCPSRAPVVGSSPRVRGTQVFQRSEAVDDWFIPACAGNSRGQPRQLGVPGGSSPRVRGTRRAECADQGDGRFIPACAGNSTNSPEGHRSHSVHPRVCGELPDAFARACSRAGSSPRVRGTLTHDDRPAHRVRFIPACAGNSHNHHLAISPIRGSSPRVRGTPEPLFLGVRQSRFIPACAGNSAPLP